MGTYAGLLLDDSFYGIAVDRRSQSGILELDFLRLAGLDLFSRYIHFSQHGSIGVENYLQVLPSPRFSQHSNLALVSYHGELDSHAVGRMKSHAELSLQRGKGYLSLASHGDGGKLYRMTVFISHPAVECKFLCHHLQGGNQAYCENE